MIPNSVKPWQIKYEQIQNQLQGIIIDLELLKGDLYALPPEELTDIGFLFRELSGILNSTRKEFDSKRTLIELILCKSLVEKAAQAGFENSMAKYTYQGVLASAKPHIKQQPKIPKRGTEEYAILCKWAGLPEEEIKKGYVSFHFPALTELLTSNAEKGLPNPPGITGVIPKFSCTFRKRNGS